MKYFVLSFLVVICLAAMARAQDPPSPVDDGLVKPSGKCTPCCNAAPYKAVCNRMLVTLKSGQFKCKDNSCQPPGTGPKK